MHQSMIYDCKDEIKYAETILSRVNFDSSSFFLLTLLNNQLNFIRFYIVLSFVFSLCSVIILFSNNFFQPLILVMSTSLLYSLLNHFCFFLDNKINELLYAEFVFETIYKDLLNLKENNAIFIYLYFQKLFKYHQHFRI